MVGQRIFQYTVLEKLGEGGMGSVWKARDEKLGRLVALKFLTKPRDPNHQARFAMEARAASSLNHPGIITIHDVLEHAHQSCIVMEFVDGRTLDRIIPPGGFPVRELIRLATQIADALAAAHKAGIIHRDIKPGNIMVTPDGRVKVLDFGLVKLHTAGAVAAGETQTLAEPHTAEGTILGTVNYMSPEQAEAKAVDARSDVFSLGAVLYEMATGRRPFQGDTTISTITAILRDEPKPLSGEVGGVPRELERAISRCLRKQPDRRFQTAIDVRNALEEIDDDLPPHPSQTEQLKAAVPLVPRRRLVWIAAAVAGVALLGLAAWAVRGIRTKAAVVESSIVVRPLTVLPGLKGGASFSPDGNAIVMTWDGGELGKNGNVYAMLLDGGRPLRLTNSAQSEGIPFYSPDGRRVYFSRVLETGPAAFWVPALGGDETRAGDGILEDISSDGQWAVFARVGSGVDRLGAAAHYIVPMQGGQERLLLPKVKDLDDYGAKFSGDNQWVYFYRSHADTVTAMRIPFAGGTPEPVHFPALDNLVSRISRVEFAKKSGETLVTAVSKTDGRDRLFLLKGDGTEPVMLPANVPGGTLSPDARRMVALSVYNTMPLYRATAFPGRGKSGELAKALDSPRGESSPRFSPDGSRLAVASTRNAKSEIWIWDSGLTSGKSVFSLGNLAGSPVWSPDGKWVAFDARLNGMPGDVWIVQPDGEGAKQLTDDPGEDIVPCFDPTGEWIYFTSSRAGGLQIFKMRRGGGPAVQVTKGGGFTCRFSADGRYLYYLQSRVRGGIWRLEVATGKEEPLIPDFQSRDWVLLRDGIYMLDPGVSSRAAISRPGEAKFYRFATRRVEKLGFVTPRPIGAQGIDVSPDGKWVLYSQIDSRSSDMQLVENLPVH